MNLQNARCNDKDTFIIFLLPCYRQLYISESQFYMSCSKNKIPEVFTVVPSFFVFYFLRHVVQRKSVQFIFRIYVLLKNVSLNQELSRTNDTWCTAQLILTVCVHDFITESVNAISPIHLFTTFIPQNLLIHKVKSKIQFLIKVFRVPCFKFYDICLPHQEIYKFLCLLFTLAVTWQQSILRKFPPISFPIILLHTVPWIPPVPTTDVTENVVLNLFFVAVWFSLKFRGYVIHTVTKPNYLFQWRL